jgi:hypothetical protein
MIDRNKLALICIALLLSEIIACSHVSKPKDMPKLYPVTMTFLQEEQPLAGATVTLMPIDPENKWDAGGVTDIHGKVILQTHGKYQGAAAGKYKICVIKVETESPPPGVDVSVTPIRLKSYHLVDQKFRDFEKTPLEIEIQGSFTQSFDLGSATKNEIQLEK